MDVFKEYDHIFLTTVLLISSFSTFAVAICTLPTELHNSVWNYQYTDLSNIAHTTTLTFGTTTLTEPSNIRLNALGTILNSWTCISNLTLSSAVSVAIFKSDAGYSDANGIRKWVYLCMKLTKVADDFFYFYLLSDEDGSVYPEERVYQSGSIPDNTVPVCSTFCQYTTQPRIRTLKKSGSSATLPGDVSLCEPCDSACEEATTDMTSLNTTQNTTSFEIDITTDKPLAETTQKITAPPTSTDMVTTTEMTPLETTQKTTPQLTSSNEMLTTTEMTLLDTTQKTKTQSTSSEIITTKEMTPLETTEKLTALLTSTEIGRTTELIPSLETRQKITTELTTIEIVTTLKTTIQLTSTEMVTTTEMTPLDTTQKTLAQSTSTDTENLKFYSGPIVLAVIAAFGSLIVIIAIVCLKGYSGANTIEKRPEKDECSYYSTVEIFCVYQGKRVQTIAIQRIVACGSVDRTNYYDWIDRMLKYETLGYTR